MATTNPYQLQVDAVKQQYDNSVKSMNDALAAQEGIQRQKTEQAVNTIRQQLDPINRNYDRSARQLYVNRRIAENRLPQQLAAVGLNGGANESSMVRLNTNYGNDLAKIREARDTSINDLNTQIANQQANGEIALGELQSNFALKLAELQNEYQKELAQAQLELQKYQLAQQAAASRSSGGGGGRSGGGGGSSSSSSSSKTTTQKTPDIDTDPYASATNQYTSPNQYNWERYQSSIANKTNQYNAKNQTAWEKYLKSIGKG